MNKETSTSAGLKDCISKLFILRDSCRGTCIAQKDNPHIIWFEGAAALLQQGVDRLKSAQAIIDKGGDAKGDDFCTDVKDTVSKLIVLKRSWIVSGSEESDENIIWFEGAESIICEVIDALQKEIGKTVPQTQIAQAPASSASESAASDTAEEPAPETAKEESKAAEAAGEEKKQAAAG